MYNHDTGKWEKTIWTTTSSGVPSCSITAWSDRKYITWLQDEVAKTGRQTKDNTWLWSDTIKYSTTCKP